ncbi:MAG: hypothetical protein LBR73_08675 [Oscillospiraceae bacterium]|jgi:hypothetical protein|nr:hypothetical protein [Oscillospiraceae bacterium]
MERYPILYWLSPETLDRNALQQIADCGFTRIPVPGTPERIREVASVCVELGLEVIAEDGRIAQAVSAGCEETRRALLENVVSDYKDCPAIKSYHVVDEPHASAFPALGAVCRILEELDPAREPYINLFPNYANRDQLGNDTYAQHVADYVRIVHPQIVSYDHYHFHNREMGAVKKPKFTDKREEAIWENANSGGIAAAPADGNAVGTHGGNAADLHLKPLKPQQGGAFFDNLEVIRNAARSNGLPFMNIVLLVEHGCYRDVSEAELRFEVFQTLAYGAARISYFTYGALPFEPTWKWRGGCVTVEGNKTRHYYDVKRINRDIFYLGQHIQSTNSTNVLHIGKEADKLVSYYTPQEPIEGITASTGLTLGFFEDGSVLLANKDYFTVNRVNLTLSAGHAIQVLDKSTGEWYALPPVTDTGNRFAFTLMPGDGELITMNQ